MRMPFKLLRIHTVCLQAQPLPENFHSVMDRPERVRRVTPPNTTWEQEGAGKKGQTWRCKI